MSEHPDTPETPLEAPAAPAPGSPSPANATKGRLLALGGLIVIGVAVFLLAVLTSKRAFPNRGLVVPGSSLDIGDQWEQDVLEWTLPIENQSDRAVEITEFSVSCNCLEHSPKSLTLSPGQTSALDLKVHLGALPPTADRPTEFTPTDFKVQVVPITPGSFQANEGWLLQGRIKKVLACEPKQLQMGTLIAKETPRSFIVHVNVNDTIPVSNLSAICDPCLASVEMTPLKPHSFDLKITPRATLSPARLAFPILLRPVAEGGQEFEPISFPVQGLVVSDVQARPNSVLFGARTIGQSASESIVFYSATGKRFEVVDFEASSPNTTIDRIPEQFEHAFRISHKFTTTGAQRGTARFRIKESDGSVNPVDVELQYNGIP